MCMRFPGYGEIYVAVSSVSSDKKLPVQTVETASFSRIASGRIKLRGTELKNSALDELYSIHFTV